jgi:hypothetical protein
MNKRDPPFRSPMVEEIRHVNTVLCLQRMCSPSFNAMTSITANMVASLTVRTLVIGVTGGTSNTEAYCGARLNSISASTISGRVTS